MLALIGMLGLEANAANLQISPVMIILRAGQSATGITMQNMGETPVYGQVRVFLWDQSGTEDVLTPTQDVVASPPILQIGPKSSQIIRLVRRSSQLPSRELSYRILIDEIPREGEGPASGVDIRLRYSVPMFVQPGDERSAPSPALTWAVFRKDDHWHLKVRNSGAARAQIGAFELANAAGKQFMIAEGLFGYVLAGRDREWRLPVPADADLRGTLTVNANINAKPATASTVAALE
ncbi:pilus assembly protein PapD [Duganella sp. Leaf126]|nr:pilus assembly protein PapD [Duganella sp. Leaf126]